MPNFFLRNAFDMSVVTQANYAPGINTNSPDFFRWDSGQGFVMTALSGLADIAVDGSFNPIAGTITAVTGADASAQTTYLITGLSVQLTSLIDITSIAASHEAYWETLLAGVSTFSNDFSAIYSLTGDFINVSATQSVTGASDSFTLNQTQATDIFGDAYTVGTGGSLAGGKDTISIQGASSASFIIAGDVQSHSGSVTGGADTITLATGLAASSVIAGDALVSDGVMFGGNDKITLSIPAAITTPDYIVTGDVRDALRQVTGGDDTIVIKPLAGPSFDAFSLSGDAHGVTTTNSFLTGGDDRLTITAVSPGNIAGDAMNQSAVSRSPEMTRSPSTRRSTRPWQEMSSISPAEP